MVAHSWGLTNPNWAATWLAVRQRMNLDAARDKALMRGVGPDYRPVPGTKLTTTSMSMTLWELIKVGDPDLEVAHLSSHSMKATALSWA